MNTSSLSTSKYLSWVNITGEILCWHKPVWVHPPIHQGIQTPESLPKHKCSRQQIASNKLLQRKQWERSPLLPLGSRWGKKKKDTKSHHVCNQSKISKWKELNQHFAAWTRRREDGKRQERLVGWSQSDWYIVQYAQLSQNFIMAASKNEWNYIYHCNDKVTIKCKRKSNKKSEVKEVFSCPRITHLISLCQKCGQIMYTNLYLGA